jgi:Mn-dependent DtxR family transcriptional regulator
MKQKEFDEEAVMKEILELTKKSRVVTTSEVAEALKISWNTAEKYLMELAMLQKVERLKKAGVNLWVPK